MRRGIQAYGGNTMRTIFLNTSIVTAPGTYTYSAASIDQVLSLMQAGEHTGIPTLSAIGHASTAEIMSELLHTKIEVNRIEYRAEVGDVAVVFKLRGRPPEGKIFTREEIESLGYDFGLLSRT